MLEVEIKLPVSDLVKIRTSLLNMGFKHKESRIEEDRYFDNAAGFIRSNGYAFRIRKITWPDTGRQIANLNFKGKKSDTVSMTREELETGIEDADAMLSIIHALGYSQRGPVLKKFRTICKKDDMEACLDEVEGLGSFLELEIMAEEAGYESAMHRIEETLHSLGYCLEDTVRTSYLSMLSKKIMMNTGEES